MKERDLKFEDLEVPSELIENLSCSLKEPLCVLPGLCIYLGGSQGNVIITERPLTLEATFPFKMFLKSRLPPNLSISFFDMVMPKPMPL